MLEARAPQPQGAHLAGRVTSDRAPVGVQVGPPPPGAMRCAPPSVRPQRGFAMTLSFMQHLISSKTVPHVLQPVCLWR